jgi:hypothetical protein
MQFRQWLESKGILIPDDIDSVIDGLVPKIMEKLPESLGNIGKDVLVASNVPLGSPYGIKSDVNVYLNSDPAKRAYGFYNTGGKITINGSVVPKQNSERHIRRALWHELGVHARDPKLLRRDLRSKLTAAQNMPDYKEYGKSYFHQPVEVDAHIGEIVHSIEKFGKQYKDRPEWAMSVLDDTLAYLRNPSLAKRTQRFGLLADPKWQDKFKQYLDDPKLKRLMFDRLYNAVARAKERIKPSAGNPASDRAKEFINKLRARKSIK